MIVETRQYLTAQLKAAMGDSTQVFYTKKELTACMESHVAAVLLESDTLEPTDTRCGPGNRLKLFSRASQYSVVMGEYSMETLEPLYLDLITNLAKQLTLLDGSRAGIELGNPEWTAQEDGILKAKVAVLIPVTVTGGIYRQIPTTSVAEVNIEIKQED